MAFLNPSIGTGRFGTGSLLRKNGMGRKEMIDEAKPSAQPSSPFRELLRTTLLSTVSPGSERVSPVKAEAETPPPSAIVAPSTYAPVGPTSFTPAPPVQAMAGNAPSAQPQVSAPVGPSNAPTSVSAPRGSVLGASTSKPANMPGNSSIGQHWATPVPPVVVSKPAGRSSFASEEAFQKAQTPTQNVLGGIGKVGTKVTTSLGDVLNRLGLPDIQLLPGGAFKQLQSKMAPLKKMIMPNFDWNRA